MSRIGSKVIVMPAGVSATLNGNEIIVSGPKGTLKQKIEKCIAVEIKGSDIHTVIANTEDSTANAKQGLYNRLIHNMVIGVSEGFTKGLLISGVGYKATVSGKKLTLDLGFSHDVNVDIPEDIDVKAVSATELVVSGIDKQKVGQFASNIRDLRPVEPYHGYGVRYKDEVVIRKVGKTAGKGKK